VEGSAADFDISKLGNQILEECVYPNDLRNPSNWGGPVPAEQAFCVSLLTRIADMLQSTEMACIFQPGHKPSLFDAIEDFLRSADERVLRISMKFVPFAYNVREIVANAIGRYLLSRARNNVFRDCPLLVFLDEAHQFLDRVIGDDVSRFNLDAFDLIAKEGRKFCLNVCLATQRPRDVPEGVLSQMGSMIVHRLINDRDREIVERASGDIDRSAAAFLPTLAPGQAIVIGVEFPMPLTLQIDKPVNPPDSKGSDFQKCWMPSTAAAPAKGACDAAAS
jgi:DNA helicase HerA-like ATPase